jgi:hypothetical protein
MQKTMCQSVKLGGHHASAFMAETETLNVGHLQNATTISTAGNGSLDNM